MPRVPVRRWRGVAQAAVLAALVAVGVAGAAAPAPAPLHVSAVAAAAGLPAADPTAAEVAREDRASRDRRGEPSALPPAEAAVPPPAEALAPEVAPTAAPPVPSPAPQPTPEPGGTSSAAPPPTGGAPAGVGLPDGVRLASHGGGRIDLGGGTLENVSIDGDVTVSGSGTLRNVRVSGHLVLRGGSGVELHSSEVAALSVSGARDVLVSGVEVFGLAGADGVHITSGTGPVADVHLRDVWIHSPQVTSDSHYDGIQVRGVTGLTLERVRVELGPFQRQHNAALFLEDANGGNSAVRVVDSWLGGGGYTLYSFASDVLVERTVFAGGNWGHLYPRSRTSEIVVFSGNTDAGGRPLTLGPDSID